MSLSQLACPDCPAVFTARTGAAATLAWAEHHHTEHTEEEP